MKLFGIFQPNKKFLGEVKKLGRLMLNYKNLQLLSES